MQLTAPTLTKSSVQKSTKTTWNNFETLQSYIPQEIENLGSSLWIVNIFDIKSQKYSNASYDFLTYQLSDKVEIPYPRDLVELLCNDFPHGQDFIPLTLVDAEYRNPINGKKGQLWSQAVGINFFIRKNEIEQESLTRIIEVIDQIKQEHKGASNPSRGLVCHFQITYNDEELKLALDENLENELDRSNIDIRFKMFDDVKIATREEMAWYVDISSTPFNRMFGNRLKILLADLSYEEDTRPFDIVDFKWNPLLEKIVIRDTAKEIEQQSSDQKEGKSPDKKIDRRDGYKNIRSKAKPAKDPNLKLFQDHLGAAKNIKAFIDHGVIKLLDIKLPTNLMYNDNYKGKISWSNQFNYKKKHKRNFRLYKYSYGSAKNTYNNFNDKYNALFALRSIKHGELILSSKKVVPMLLDEFITFFDGLDSSQKKSFQLVFAGKLDKNGVHNELNYKQNQGILEYVLEFGYGRVVVVNENQILFNNVRFNNAQNILFHGDRLRNIKTTKGKIECYKIDYSNTKLYRDSLQNTIHTLFIDTKTKRIKKVIGHSTNHFNISQSHGNLGGINLSFDSKNYLMNNYDPTEVEEVILYGKVNSEVFEKSEGKDLQFDIINLSSENVEIKDSLMFFIAKDIVKNNNGIRLDISPFMDNHSLSKTDESYKEHLYIKKRDFSADAYKLIELFNERSVRSSFHSEIIRDQLLLIKVNYDTEKSKHSYSLIGSRKSIESKSFQMPIRRINSIFPHLARNSFVTGVVINLKRSRKYGKVYRVELRPGIFVEIEISNENDRFVSGDIVRITTNKQHSENDLDKPDNERGPVKIFFELLISSDNRHFQHTKFINVLPKNSIIKFKNLEDAAEEDSPLMEKSYFVGAEFPNTELSLAPSKKEQIIEFLKNPNRMIEVSGGKMRLQSSSNYKFTSSSIEIDKDSNVKLPELSRNISYDSLSFGETSNSEMLKILKREKWSYLDEVSPMWDEEIQDWRFVKFKDRNYRNSHLPVFITPKGSYSMRPIITKERTYYSIPNIEEITKISLPTRELIRYLKRKNPLFRYAENGNSKNNNWPFLTVVLMHEENIWIELSPGRIVESRTSFIRIKDTLLTLNSLPDGVINTGDRMKLSLKQVNYKNFEQEIIEVIEWIPSNKVYFEQKSILPCERKKYNNVKEMVLGKGQFQTRVPYKGKYVRESHLTFSSFEYFIDLVPRNLNSLDRYKTLLYKKQDQLRITIPGFTSYTIALNNKKEHSLKKYFTEDNIHNLLRGLGGYLPVNISSVDKTKKEIKVSLMAFNKIKVENKKVLIANVLSLLDEDTFLMKSGALLFAWNIKPMLENIPKEVVTKFFVKALQIHFKNEFYLTQTEKGLRQGLITSSSQSEFKAKVYFPVITQAHSGIIISNKMNKAIHLVDYEDCCWVKNPYQGSKKEILNAICKAYKDQEITVAYDANTNKCSLIDTERALTEFTGMYKEKSISVDYIKELEGLQHKNRKFNYHLVRSKYSNILLLAESSLKAKEEKQENRNNGRVKNKATNLDAEKIKTANVSVVDFSKQNRTVLLVIGDPRIEIDTHKLYYNKEFFNYNLEIDAIDSRINEETFQVASRESIGNQILSKKSYLLYEPLKYLNLCVDTILEGYEMDEEIKKIIGLNLEIIKDLGFRALRERHIESLTANWINSKSQKKRKSNLWGRINKIGVDVIPTKENIKPVNEITKQNISSIKDLYDIALPLRKAEDVKEDRKISESLMVSIGQSENIFIAEELTPIITLLWNLAKEIISKEGSLEEKALYESLHIKNWIENIFQLAQNKGFFYLRENLLKKYMK